MSQNHVYISEDEANATCDILTEYWHSKGKKSAMFWVKRITVKSIKSGSNVVYGIRSNLVGGRPPGN